MAIQLLPIIKAVAPYIAQIATAAIPAFTSKPKAQESDPVLARQIEELQAAATQNAQSIHLLAEKMQLAIQEVETAALEARKQVAIYKALLFVSLGLAILSASACIYAVLE
ncbi:MAG: folylpolyglutamate synthase/dihydropteroate synthase [Motiliproteus sp.]|jgi:folylpolyglutamate synthase/dihydropteroate synthase